MPFVLFLFFGLWFLLICAGDAGMKTGQIRAYRKERPPHKYQEEFLLRYELYRRYKQDPHREDPIGDACEDAGQQIYDQGYLPMECGTMSAWQKAEVRRSAGGMILNFPEYKELLKWRKQDSVIPDRTVSNPDLSLEANGKMITDKTFEQREEQWDAYNHEIDLRWAKLVEEINKQDYKIEDHPPALALEYLTACAIYREIRKGKRRAKEKDIQVCCPLSEPLIAVWRARLVLIGENYMPSSLAPMVAQDEESYMHLYQIEERPNEDTLRALLRQDKKGWTKDKYEILRAIHVYGDNKLEEVVERKNVTSQEYADWVWALYRHYDDPKWLARAYFDETGIRMKSYRKSDKLFQRFHDNIGFTPWYTYSRGKQVDRALQARGYGCGSCAAGLCDRCQDLTYKDY